MILTFEPLRPLNAPRPHWLSSLQNPNQKPSVAGRCTLSHHTRPHTIGVVKLNDLSICEEVPQQLLCPHALNTSSSIYDSVQIFICFRFYVDDVFIDWVALASINGLGHTNTPISSVECGMIAMNESIKWSALKADNFGRTLLSLLLLRIFNYEKWLWLFITRFRIHYYFSNI